MEEKLKVIPQTFKKNGYHFTLLNRAGGVALYSQHNQVGHISAYEVHIIRKRALHPRFKGDSGLLDAGFNSKEFLPSNEEFGSYGWSFDTLGTAEKQIQELLNRKEVKQ